MNTCTSKFLPLQNLLSTGRRQDFVVAWSGGVANQWCDFSRTVGRLSATLQQRPELRWGLYLTDGYLFAVALMALLHSGKIPVLLGSNRPGVVVGLASEVDALLGDFELAGGITVSTIDQLLESSPGEPECRFSELDSGQTLELFTSGSTGEPKREEKQLGQIFAELQTLQNKWGERLGNAVTVATVSHQHIYGMLFKVLWPLSSGRAFVSTSYQDPQSLLEDVGCYSHTCWVASPAHLKRLHDALPWQQAKQKLTAVFSSGGPLPALSAQQLQQWLGEPPLEVYGSTESGGIAWRQQWVNRDKNNDWQVFPGVELSQDAQGQLQLRSPHLLENITLTMADAVRVTGEDTFQLLGRVDRIVKIEGKRLSLPELESRLEQNPRVKEARALLLEQKGRQQVGVAVVLSAIGESDFQGLGKSTLARQLKAELGFYYEAVLLPRKWRFVEQIPVNAQGKLLKKELSALFNESPAADNHGQLGRDPKTLPRVISEQSTDNGLAFELLVSADLIYLPGHFPSAPIVPGVVQIRWAEYFGRQHFQLGAFASMESIKFQKVLRPDTHVQLLLTFDDSKKTLGFCFQSGEAMYSQGRLKFV